MVFDQNTNFSTKKSKLWQFSMISSIRRIRLSLSRRTVYRRLPNNPFIKHKARSFSIHTSIVGRYACIYTGGGFQIGG